MKCPTCKDELKLRVWRQETTVGRWVVHDDTAPQWTCRGRHHRIHPIAGRLFMARALRVVLAEAPSVSGPEVRAARRHLRLTQSALAAHLDVPRVAVSRWETDRDPIPKVTRLALLALLVARESIFRLLPVRNSTPLAVRKRLPCCACGAPSFAGRKLTTVRYKNHAEVKALPGLWCCECDEALLRARAGRVHEKAFFALRKRGEEAEK